MSKRLIAFLSILSLSLALPLIPASAVAKAGAKCTKAGSTEVVQGRNTPASNLEKSWLGIRA